MTALLEVSNLNIFFTQPDGSAVVPVDDVTFSVAPGELVALVGESGCGKTLTGLALPRLLPRGAELGARSVVRFAGTDLTSLGDEELRGFRGRRIAMVFQDPMTSLNPVMRIGAQVAEAIHAHQKISRADARERVLALLTEVGIADPTSRIDAYPHQLSGGMRQRVLIAMALAAEPELIVADEPTTALDVTIQAQILELLDHLRATRRLAVLLITHDLGIVAGRADRVLVMYAGRIVEAGPTASIFARPTHPYTQGLFASIPRLDATTDRLTPIGGSVPRPEDWPDGCRFHPRCPVAIQKCRRERPALEPTGPNQLAACWVAQGATN